jgi:hypothetical protein
LIELHPIPTSRAPRRGQRVHQRFCNQAAGCTAHPTSATGHEQTSRPRQSWVCLFALSRLWSTAKLVRRRGKIATFLVGASVSSARERHGRNFRHAGATASSKLTFNSAPLNEGWLVSLPQVDVQGQRDGGVSRNAN